MMAEAMAPEGFTDETIVDYREDDYRLRGLWIACWGIAGRKPSPMSGFGKRIPTP